MDIIQVLVFCLLYSDVQSPSTCQFLDNIALRVNLMEMEFAMKWNL